MEECMRWKKAIFISLFVHGVSICFGFLYLHFTPVMLKTEEYTEIIIVRDKEELETSDAQTNLDNTEYKAEQVSRQHLQNNRKQSAHQGTVGDAKAAFGAAAGIRGDIAIAGFGDGREEAGLINGSADHEFGDHESDGPKGDQSRSATLNASVEPVYPERDRRANREGVVWLEFTVLPDGAIINVEILKSDCSAAMEKAAIDCVKKWEYTPARDANGVKVAARKKAKVTFNLRNQ
ncbi:energy transducer TonB [Anaerosinus massiliensis]|uniref:energy transducer TonB n=1 Tax=Massilibacillus massiliensis TaxID=1806837 RepID=UPI000DA60E08|nr:energy transducer TonB [Massilibacillus massiliensis]